MTLANSTFSREPNQQLPCESTSQYLTDSIFSCLSSDTMPPSSETWHDVTGLPTESVLRPQTLVNNSFQSTCFVQLLSHRPTTRERHVINNTRHSKINATRRWKSLQRAKLELRCEWFMCKTMHVRPSLFSVR